MPSLPNDEFKINLQKPEHFRFPIGVILRENIWTVSRTTSVRLLQRQGPIPKHTQTQATLTQQFDDARQYAKERGSPSTKIRTL